MLSDRHDFGKTSFQANFLSGWRTSRVIPVDARRAPRPSGLVSMTENLAQSASRMVLVVDDLDEIRDFTAAVLRSAGFEVLTASSPQEALKVSADTPGVIDLLVADVGLPGMTGAELVRRLTRSRPQLRVVLFSGESREHLVRTGVIDAGSLF